MDPDLSSDQRLLRDTTERFIEDSLPLETVRHLIDSGEEVDPSYRTKVADLGWFAFLAPEDLGGGGVSGEGLLDAVIFAELRGKYLQPGTFIDTNVIVDSLVRDGSAEQNEKMLPALVSGEAAAAWAVAGPSGDWSGATGVACTRSADGYRLDGLKTLVVEAQSADWILVTATAPEGLTQLLLPTSTPGLTVEVREGLDLSRRLCQVRFDAVEADRSTLVGRPGSATEAVAAQLQVATALSMGETVGAMQYVFDLSVQYCKDRIAFGRPIGSFQGIKHQLADTSLAVEMSQACAAGAAHALQSRSRESAHASSLAKAFVADAAVEVAHKSWQLFGGISYTWEHDFHFYLRRLTADASLYGSATWHRERVCELAGV